VLFVGLCLMSFAGYTWFGVCVKYGPKSGYWFMHVQLALQLVRVLQSCNGTD